MVFGGSWPFSAVLGGFLRVFGGFWQFLLVLGGSSWFFVVLVVYLYLVVVLCLICHFIFRLSNTVVIYLLS